MKTIWKPLILATATLVVCSPLFAQNVPPQRSACNSPATGTTPAGFSERDPRYRIQPGDSFEVTFEFVPDFNQAATVQPDGFVTMKGIGDVKVGGQTVPELTTTLATRDVFYPASMPAAQAARPPRYI
jgi:protein involved in polysaccharide export with SLBB domain